MNEAKGAFARWHLISMSLNFGTIFLVTVGMALAARLPAEMKIQLVTNPSPGANERSRMSSSEEVAIQPRMP
jgi:hypothetical protein